MGTRNLGPAFWLRSTARRASRLAKRTSPIDSAAHAPRFSCSRPLSRLRLFTLANLVRQPCVCVCVRARVVRVSLKQAALDSICPPLLSSLSRDFSRGGFDLSPFLVPLFLFLPFLLFFFLRPPFIRVLLAQCFATFFLRRDLIL